MSTNFLAYQRRDGSAVYRRQIRIHGKKVCRNFSRKTDADRWYDEKKREKELVENGLVALVKPTYLEDFAVRWMSDRRLQGKPLGVWNTEESRMRLYVIPAFKKRFLHQITSHEWETFFNSLIPKRGLGNATRNRVRALVHKLYQDALRQQASLQNPISIIPKLKESNRAYDYFETQEECAGYLREAAKEFPGFFLFAVLALNTGMRLGEILALSYKDVLLNQRRFHIWRIVDLKEERIVERTKNNHDRWLGINDELFGAIVEHKQKTGPQDLLVCDEKGKLVKQGRLRKTHYRVCQRAGLKPIRVHDLRHTYASHYIMNGGSVADLQGLWDTQVLL